MKKIVLAIACVFFISSAAVAQCIPDVSIVVPGVYPDTIQNLPHATVGSQYDADIQIKVWTDTNTFYLGFPVHACFDSIVVTGVSGLPSGYFHSCVAASCSFPGGGNGCVHLHGSAPMLADVGMVYPISVYVTAYLVVCGGFQHATLLDTITGYSIVVDNNTAIQNQSISNFDVWQNVPNPFRGISEISLVSPKNDVITFKVSNLLGKIIYTKTIYAPKGLNKITLSSKDFESGIYIYSISNSRNTVTRRMIVSHE